MKRKTATIISILILAAVILALALYFFSDDQKTYDWRDSFRGSTDQPYGTLFIKKLLASRYDEKNFTEHDRKPLSELLEDNRFDKNTDFVFIGDQFYQNDTDRIALLTFVEKGNTAFIATNELPELIKDAYNQECVYNIELDESYVSSATLNFYHPSLRDKYGYQFTFRQLSYEANYQWNSFPESIFCDSTKSITAIGYAEPGNVNFIKMKYGEGVIYIHLNPIAFTNYFIIKKQKLQYAEKVFAHLNGEQLIWDEYGKLPQFNKESEDNNPLYFIMQQRSLKYAWWIMVVLIMLYVLFTAKRTQRVIPILEEKTNTSLEYIKMVSSLHHKNENHLGMAQKKMKYFQYFIRTKYGIHTSPFSEDVAAKISEKSEVPLSDVKAIFNLHKLIDQGSGQSIEPSRLVNFYYAIENFYKNCK